jgi:hypothetical protein
MLLHLCLSCPTVSTTPQHTTINPQHHSTTTPSTTSYNQSTTPQLHTSIQRLYFFPIPSVQVTTNSSITIKHTINIINFIRRFSISSSPHRYISISQHPHIPTSHFIKHTISTVTYIIHTPIIVTTVSTIL